MDRRSVDKLFMEATGAGDPNGSLAWLSREMAVSWDTVYSWVSGRRNPSPSQVRHFGLIERAVDAGVYGKIRVG